MVDHWQRLRSAFGHDTLIMPGAAGAILQQNQVLLVFHRGQKLWQIPGGLQEPGESIPQTAEREIREELGLEMSAGELISVYSTPQWNIEFSNGDKVQQLLFFFRMEGTVTTLNLQQIEVSMAQFFPLDNIPQNTFECCKQKVDDLKKYTGSVIFH